MLAGRPLHCRARRGAQVGVRVNVEAGAVVCNFRNEDAGSPRMKFGALVGDDSRIGANAVLAPGTILIRRTIVARLTLVDQWTSSA